MVNPNFSDDILLQIFSRLPTKSVGRCRCLSKTWKTNLSTSQFIKSHLIHKPKINSIILFSEEYQTLQTLTSISQHSTVSNVLVLGQDLSKVVGSCNGLVLLLCEDEQELVLINPITLQQVMVTIPKMNTGEFEEELVLFNPITLQQVMVTIPKMNTEEFAMPAIIGFGYDSSADDYKIVTINYYENPDGEDALVGVYSVKSLVRVYSVKSDVWRTVNDPPYAYFDFDPLPGNFVNGAVHFSVSLYEENSRRTVVAAFDLANEVFHEIVTPIRSEGSNVYPLVFFGVLEGCLSFVSRNGLTFELWMMKEYGLFESWTKLITIHSYNEHIVLFDALCFLRDDEILSIVEGRVVVYGLGDGERKYEVGDEDDAEYFGLSFVDSLVSPSIDSISG